jgi:hypothetical protein
MEGLYYFHGLDGITFLLFYPNSRVISFGSSGQANQSSSAIQWLSRESEKIHFSRGIYHIDIWDNIRITVKGDYGTMVYRGFVRDENTIDLYCKCPFTNFKTLKTYQRFSSEHHIIHKQISDICAN